MPPEETLGDLMRQIGIYDAPAQTRSPLQTALQTPRPRPMPRQMRGADLRALDPNAGVRRQAQRELSMRDAALSDPRTAPRAPVTNQFAEAGAMAFEGTGLPAVRRGAANITRGAMNQDPYQGLQQLGGGALELGLGALGAASIGEFGAVRPRPTPAPRAPVAPPEPMPRMTPPPREIAPNGMPIRPAQPFRNSLRGGSDDLAEAASMRARAPDVGNAGRRQPRRVVDIVTPRGETHETIINPSEADILRLTKPRQIAGSALERGVPSSSARGVRYIKDPEGNIYVGNSYDMTHHDLVTRHGLPNRGLLDGGEIVRREDGTLELQNNDGAMSLPRDWLNGRAPNAPARGSEGSALQAPTLPPNGADPSVRRGIFGPPPRPGIRDMQPEGIYGDASSAPLTRSVHQRSYGGVDETVFQYTDASGESIGEITLKTGPFGRLYITGSQLTDEGKIGQGLGVRMYQDLADWAEQNGKTLYSDNLLTDGSRRIYPALARRGYDIRNVSKNVQAHPYQYDLPEDERIAFTVGAMDGRPLYRIGPKRGANSRTTFYGLGASVLVANEAQDRQ